MQNSFFVYQLLYFIVFGGLLGSFCNVVILRIAESRSVVFPPSSCPYCKHRLGVTDLIPVLSWLYLRGACRYCKSRISVQYPLVEASVSTIMGMSFYFANNASELIINSSQGVILFVISVIILRNEVKSPLPYFWGLVYFLILNRLSGICLMLDQRLFLSLSIVLLTAIVAEIQYDFKNFEAWLFAGLIIMLFLPNIAFIYKATALTIAATVSLINRPSGRSFLFAVIYSAVFFMTSGLRL